MKIIKQITFNWLFSPIENSEGYERRTVGEKSISGMVVLITEHSAKGEGDKWFYDIEYENGAMERTFNPNSVFYAPENQA
jgi:hypothetical protein